MILRRSALCGRILSKFNVYVLLYCIIKKCPINGSCVLNVESEKLKVEFI